MRCVRKGVSLSKKGQMDEAITWYDKALEVETARLRCDA